MGDDELLSLVDAGKMTGYDPSALRRLAIAKKFPAAKIGGRWITTRRKVKRWMESDQYHPGGGRPKKKP